MPKISLQRLGYLKLLKSCEEKLLQVWRRSLMDYKIFVLMCKIHDEVRKEWQLA